MKLCAMVPVTGMPYFLPAKTFEVAETPATKKARAPLTAASRPCARRPPKSTIGRPRAA